MNEQNIISTEYRILPLPKKVKELIKLEILCARKIRKAFMTPKELLNGTN